MENFKLVSYIKGSYFNFIQVMYLKTVIAYSAAGAKSLRTARARASNNPEDLQLYCRETPMQVFSFEYCEIFKSSFFYRTTPVADYTNVKYTNEKSVRMKSIQTKIIRMKSIQMKSIRM